MIKLVPHRQKPAYCGPSSLKMVLEHFGVKKSEDELGRLAKTSTETGTLSENLVAAAKKLGFKGFVKDDATIDDIRKWIKNGIPVIVDWFSVDEGHYSVAVGVTKKSILLMDPEYARVRRFPIEKFEILWFDFTPEGTRTRKSLVLRRMIVIHP